MSEVLILNGRLVDPASGVDAERDLLLRDGRVAAVENAGWVEGCARRRRRLTLRGWSSRRGWWMFMCICGSRGRRTRSRSRRGRLRLRRADLRRVVAMPNTVPVNDSVAGLEWMLDAARGACIKLLAMPAATFGSRGEEITDFHRAGRGWGGGVYG